MRVKRRNNLLGEAWLELISSSQTSLKKHSRQQRCSKRISVEFLPDCFISPHWPWEKTRNNLLSAVSLWTFILMLFSNKNKTVFRILSCDFLLVCVWILEDKTLNQLQHLFTSKKTTVLSNCLLYCMGACINGSNSESQCGVTKTSTKELERPFFFLFLLGDFFCFRVGRGAWDFRFLRCNMVRRWRTPKALALSWPHDDSDSWRGGGVYAATVQLWSSS